MPSRVPLKCIIMDAESGISTKLKPEPIRSIPEYIRTNSGEEFEVFEQIGKGTYGVVYTGLSLHTGELVAIKVTSPEGGLLAPATMRELCLLRKFKHPNVVSFIDHGVIPSAKDSEGDLVIVMELADMDLRDYMKQHDKNTGPLGQASSDSIRSLMRDLLTGVAYMHEQGIIHCDLKPGNLLVDSETEHLKLADFGIATFNRPDLGSLTNDVMAVSYRAPEVVIGVSDYDNKIDIWACGCIMAELMKGLATRSFFRVRELDDKKLQAERHLEEIMTQMGSPSPLVLAKMLSRNPAMANAQLRLSPARGFLHNMCVTDEYALDLLTKLLAFDPAERISAAEALEHPYMFGEKPMPEFCTRLSRSTAE